MKIFSIILFILCILLNTHFIIKTNDKIIYLIETIFFISLLYCFIIIKQKEVISLTKKILSFIIKAIIFIFLFYNIYFDIGYFLQFLYLLLFIYLPFFISLYLEYISKIKPSAFKNKFNLIFFVLSIIYYLILEIKVITNLE